MTQREKLIEIISEKIYPKEGVDYAEVVADFLIDRGVVVLPCKVGDTVYLKSGRKKVVYEFEIDRVFADKEELYFFTHEVFADGRQSTSYESFNGSEIGKTVFLTREEAEAALKKMEGEK